MGRALARAPPCFILEISIRMVLGGVVNKKRIMLLVITSLGLACGGLAMIYNPILDPGNYSSTPSKPSQHITHLARTNTISRTS